MHVAGFLNRNARVFAGVIVPPHNAGLLACTQATCPSAAGLQRQARRVGGGHAESCLTSFITFWLWR